MNEKLIVSITGLRFDRPARIDDIGRAIEFTHLVSPGLLLAEAIDRAYKNAIGGGRRWLLQFPEILA